MSLIEGSNEKNKTKKINTRGVLTVASVILLLAFAIFFTWEQNRFHSYEQTAFVMGTVFQIALEAEGEDPTPELIRLGNELEKETLSYRVDTSEIAAINQSAGSSDGYELSSEMEDILMKCLTISEQTDGAFDITIGTLTKLWDIDGWASGDNEAEGREFSPPSEEEIRKALEISGYEKVRLDDHRIYMPEGMSLDLGAIGKGIYLDSCGKLLDVSTRGIISAGGSIRTCGKKSDSQDWNVGITDPFSRSDIYGSIPVSENLCVSTSGPYERYVEYNNKRYHHILDPHTGYPVETDIASVTIVSDSGIISDALSTACFVTGEKKALELSEKYGADILIIKDDGSQTGTISVSR